MGKFIGKPVRRREDIRLISGRGTYVDDITLPNTLYLGVVRSQYPHARIKSIDFGRALSVEGVRYVFTGEDFRDATSLPGEFRLTVKGSNIPRYLPLAVDRVRYVGEPVVAVLADSKYAVRDAVELVEVEYEPLEPVVDVEKALSPDAPILHEEFGSNVSFEMELGDKSGVEEAFSNAEVVVSGEFTIERVSAVPIETRSILASYDRGSGFLTAWVTTQLPHRERSRIARTLGIPENMVRVIAPDVGGGFGEKLNYYPEYYLACLLAYRLGRPIKWTSTRSEDLIASGHGRGVRCKIELASTRDGKITGLRATMLADLGAYVIDTTQRYSVNAAQMLTGAYDIRNAYVKLYGVFTNKPPTSAYRGAGRPEAMVFIEWMVDKLARRLGIDPVEIRLRNFIKPENIPYTNFSGIVYDSGDFGRALEKAVEIARYSELRREQAITGDGKVIGIGVATYVERNSFGWESAVVRVEPSGKVVVLTGSSPHGQGEETSFSQIVADELGVDLEDVAIIHGDTVAVPMGAGTGGSKTVTIGGSAIVLACREIKEKAKRIAAHFLEARVEDLVYEDGAVKVAGVPEKAMTLKEIAEKAYSTNIPTELTGLIASTYYNNENALTSYGAHVAVVEIDRETLEIRVRKGVMVDECGRVVNPLLVEGQIVGGAVQAVGEALYEVIQYTENGQPLVSTLAEYPVPTACETPSFETAVIETPSNTPLGSRGVGESGTIGFLPALVNAIQDAVSRLNNVEINKLPITPDYLWNIIKKYNK